jgi:PEP-CTERM motif
VTRTFVLAFFSVGVCFGANIAPFYAGSYTLKSLGSVSGVPGPYGGLAFLPGDPNTLLLGGSANNTAGVIDAIGVLRDADGHITGFNGTATQYAIAPNIDGGLTFGPGGVLFYTAYPTNQIGQIKPGSTNPDTLTPAPVNSSVGTLGFVPAGFNGAGNFIVASYNGGSMCVASLTPDGTGTYAVGGCSASVTTGGGPEGIVWAPLGSPLFPNQTMLVSEYAHNRVSAYETDSNGLPIPATRKDFVQGLNGAEGAVIDPVTGDFLFSTFGSGNQIMAVRGFAAPEPATLALAGASLIAFAIRRRRPVD